MNAVIRSIGAYAPEKRLTNDDLDKSLDTSDEWIRQHTGIGSRHLVADGQATSDLAYEAARIALERAELKPKDVDLIIVATVAGDFPGFPATASIVQDMLGSPIAGAFDLAAGCTGFVYGLEVARSMILSGSVRNALVIGAEVLSRITDWSDRRTCVLFGDGAGAAVVSSYDGKDNRGILDSLLRSDGSGARYLERTAGGTRFPIDYKRTPPSDLFLQMNGRQVYNFAVRVNAEAVTSILERNDLTLDDITYIVPHQANIRIINASAKRLGVPPEKFYTNIEEYANTSGASIPLALNEMHENGKLNEGDLIVTVGFGAGLTYGGNLIRW